MTMHTVFFKQHEAASINGPRWSGSDRPPAVGAYGEAFAAHSEVLSAAQNRQGLQGKGNISSTHFTLFSGECKSVENGEKTPPQTICSVQADYRGHFELGFGQPLSCDSKYPYAEQWYGGVYSNYGTQIAGRMMLPLSVSSDGGPILVNAKQYSGIMRRRKKRAEAEAENRLLKLRKPYLHLSRHLHAMRRPRGNGGRFLNTKKSNGSKDQGGSSPLCDGGVINSSKGTNNGSSRSTSPGSEVSSQLLFSRGDNNRHASFQVNHQILHCPSFHSLEDAAANTGLGMGIGMASGGNYYLKV